MTAHADTVRDRTRQTIPGPPLNADEHEAIAQVKRHPRFHPTSVATDVAHHLYAMVRDSRPAVCVEVGCHLGYSTTYLAKALSENGAGRLYTFDLDTSNAAATVARAGLSDVVTFTDGPSVERMRETLGGVHDIGLAFIDGDHTRHGCLADFQVVLPRLSVGAVVILHDIYPAMCAWRGPRLLIDLLRAAQGKPGVAQFEIEERNDLDPFGIAICRLTDLGTDPLRQDGLLDRLTLAAETSRAASRWEWAQFTLLQYRLDPKKQITRAIRKRLGRV